MIRDFWVKNFLSIKDRQGLDFTAKASLEECPLVVKIKEGVYLNKLGILYGANASGKSNMLFALQKIFSILLEPETDASKEVGNEPFALTKEEPTEMHISFYVESIRYDYDVSFNKNVILKESLYYYPNTAKALFYERFFVNEGVQSDISFGRSVGIESKTQQSIRENVLNNHSVLSVCKKNSFKENAKQIYNLHKKISDHFHPVFRGANSDRLVQRLKKVYEDKEKLKIYELLLKKADLNIDTFLPITDENDLPEEIRNEIESSEMPEEIKKQLLHPDSILYVNHAGSDSFQISHRLQSVGTKKFLSILDPLYDMITDNHVYLLDELGEDLHSDLLVFYINIFLYNSDKSQLLFTSQEAALLAEDLLNNNRFAVWFVEKNTETATSEYSRADSFGLHKNLSLYNSYKIGRLGARPEVGSIFLNLKNLQNGQA